MKLVIDQEAAQNILNYLLTQPYGEVALMVESLKNLPTFLPAPEPTDTTTTTTEPHLPESEE